MSATRLKIGFEKKPEHAFFPSDASLSYYQKLMYQIYALPGDRNFSISDILVQQQRFTMRALKGIRKGDRKKLELNLLDAFSWAISVANRFHFDIEEILWRRFPYCCSYCGKTPCSCKKKKVARRVTITVPHDKRPQRLADFQKMFEAIYPAKTRTLEHAGVHLAEEMGEVSEAIHAFLSEHQKLQLEEIKVEIADYISCVFGVANSAGISIARGSAKLFTNNCFVCHEAPCECNVASINKFKF